MSHGYPAVRLVPTRRHRGRPPRIDGGCSCVRLGGLVRGSPQITAGFAKQLISAARTTGGPTSMSRAEPANINEFAVSDRRDAAHDFSFVDGGGVGGAVTVRISGLTTGAAEHIDQRKQPYIGADSSRVSRIAASTGDSPGSRAPPRTALAVGRTPCGHAGDFTARGVIIAEVILASRDALRPGRRLLRAGPGRAARPRQGPDRGRACGSRGGSRQAPRRSG